METKVNNAILRFSGERIIGDGTDVANGMGIKITALMPPHDLVFDQPEGAVWIELLDENGQPIIPESAEVDGSIVYIAMSADSPTEPPK